MNKLKADQEGRIRLRCHFSIIIESVWQFWLVILIFLFNQIDDVLDFIRSLDNGTLREFMAGGGLIGLLVILALTLLVLLWQFLRWRKTLITLDGNLIIIERSTLNKKKSTIAIENVSAVNMERNLFERIVGTYRLKLDTNSMTTANKTDVSIVLREDVALAFRQLIIARMNILKGGQGEIAEERQPDKLTQAAREGKRVLHCGKNDMLKHMLYTLPLLSVLVVVAGLAAAIYFSARYGFDTFLRQAVGGFIAVVLMVLGSMYNIVKKFFRYYDFTVYRDGKDLHVSCGLIKLRSYTIPVDKITAIEIDQPLVSRLLGRYNAKVVTVGLGDEEGESSNITLSLTAGELKDWLGVLVPEYDFAAFDSLMREESCGASVRAVKAVKWQLASALAVFALLRLTDWPAWIAIGAPLAVDLFILLLYVLSHKAAGYMILDEGMIVRSGYFALHYALFKYERMQSMTMNYHPVAERHGCGCGLVSLLNSAENIPYIKKESANEISDRMIGGTK